MIYLTGDTHSDFTRFNRKNFPDQKQLTKNDYVIILGDFGGIWEEVEDNYEKYWLDWLNEKNFTTLFIDGNHENFDRLYSMPVYEWKGGKIHKIRPSVFHLLRGQVFNIDRWKFFTMGGSKSHDIDDGVLNKDDKKTISMWRKKHRRFRINHLNWWQEEIPSDEEMMVGMNTLREYQYKVDYILTHCAPSSIHMSIQPGYQNDKLTEYLEIIKSKTSYQAWYFGHYHLNRIYNKNHILLYDRIIQL